MNCIRCDGLDDLRGLPAATRFQIATASMRPQYRCSMRLPAVVDISAHERCLDDFLLESEICTAPIRQCGFNQMTAWKPLCAAWPMQATFAHHGGKVWDIAYEQFINLGIDDCRIARCEGNVSGHFL